jgi:hypothetical protein
VREKAKMSNSPYNILVVTSMTSYATANYLVTALRSSGCNLFVCSDSPSQLVNFIAAGAVDVQMLATRAGITPDLLLFIEGGTMQLFPVGLEKLACLTAWYGIDTHMDYQKHLRIARLFDVTFIAQKEYVERLQQDGIRQVHWLPLAFAPELLPEKAQKRTIDVAFVGSDNKDVHPERHQLLSVLRSRFSSHFLGMASPEKMMEIYSTAKIVFNKSVNNDLNMRYFEALGAGAVLVTDPIVGNGVEDTFIRNQHFFEFQDQTTLVELVQRLLANNELDNLGKEARQWALAHHTYQHRAVALLKRLSESKKISHPVSVEYFGALLALHMTPAALDAAASALRQQQGGRKQKLLVGMAGIGLAGIIMLSHIVEKGFAIVRRR